MEFECTGEDQRHPRGDCVHGFVTSDVAERRAASVAALLPGFFPSAVRRLEASLRRSWAGDRLAPVSRPSWQQTSPT